MPSLRLLQKRATKLRLLLQPKPIPMLGMVVRMVLLVQITKAAALLKAVQVHLAMKAVQKEKVNLLSVAKKALPLIHTNVSQVALNHAALLKKKPKSNQGILTLLLCLKTPVKTGVFCFYKPQRII